MQSEKARALAIPSVLRLAQIEVVFNIFFDKGHVRALRQSQRYGRAERQAQLMTVSDVLCKLTVGSPCGNEVDALFLCC